MMSAQPYSDTRQKTCHQKNASGPARRRGPASIQQVLAVVGASPGERGGDWCNVVIDAETFDMGAASAQSAAPPFLYGSTTVVGDL